MWMIPFVQNKRTHIITISFKNEIIITGIELFIILNAPEG